MLHGTLAEGRVTLLDCQFGGVSFGANLDVSVEIGQFDRTGSLFELPKRSVRQKNRGRPSSVGDPPRCPSSAPGAKTEQPLAHSGTARSITVGIPGKRTTDVTSEYRVVDVARQDVDPRGDDSNHAPDEQHTKGADYWIDEWIVLSTSSC